jgi:molybdopterin-guanine dinucleotide biosynthesis protein A
LIESAVGAVIAGGRSRRFGSEKAAALFGGRTLLECAVAHLAAHAEEIVVNAPAASGAAALARDLGLAVAPDAAGDPAGPLAGLRATLAWAQAKGRSILLTAPCDTPLLPAELYPRLAAALAVHDVAVAEADDGLHPLCGAWRTSALPPLAAALAGGAHPPVRNVLTALGAAHVRFDDAAAFANINTPEDLARAEAKLPGAR